MKNIVLIILTFSLLYSCKEQSVTEVNSGGKTGSLAITGTENLSSLLLNDVNNDIVLTLSHSGEFPVSNIALSGLNETLTYKGGGSYPGVDGTCSTSLSSGSTCTIHLRSYSETSVKIIDQLTISFNDGIYNQSYSYDYDIEFSNPAEILFTTGITTNTQDFTDFAAPAFSFLDTPIGESKTQILSAMNAGDRIATLNGQSFTNNYFTFTGGTYPGINGNCSSIFEANNICQIEIEYTPLTTGVNQGSLDLNFTFTPNESLSVVFPLSGPAVNSNAEIKVSTPSQVDLGSIAQGLQQDIEITLSNPTAYNATSITSTITNNNVNAFSFKNGTYPGTGGDCTTSLSPFSTCKIIITHDSTNLGLADEILQLTYYDNALIGPQTQNFNFDLKATNATIATLAFSQSDSSPSSPTLPGASDFGVVALGQTLTNLIAIKNIGQTQASFLTYNIINNSNNVYQIRPGGSCSNIGLILNENDFCQLRIRAFGALAGVENSILRITYNDGKISTTQDISITVNIIEPATLTLTEATNLDTPPNFVGVQSESKYYSLVNSTSQPATALDFQIQTAGIEIDPVNTTCTTTLAGGSSCVYAYFLKSPAANGPTVQNFLFSYNNGLQTLNRNIQKTYQVNTRASLRLLEEDTNGLFTTVINDGGAALAGSSPASVTISKSLQISQSGGVNSAQAKNINVTISDTTHFSINSAPATSLLQGSSSTFNINFHPQSNGVKNTTLTINYDDSLGSLTPLTYTLSGTGEDIGILSITPEPVDFPSATEGTIPSQATITLQNTGTADITGVTFPNDPTFPYVSDDCSFPLSPTQTCSAVFEMNVPLAGFQSSTVKFEYGNSSYVANKYVLFRGTVLTPPFLSVTPSFATDADFGTAPLNAFDTDTFQMTITNTGETDAENLNITLNQVSSVFVISINNCNGTTLIFNGSCFVKLLFKPDSIASFTGTLSLDFANSNISNQTLPLVKNILGEGVNPSALFNKWFDITSTSDDTTSQIYLSWQPFTSSDDGIAIDGYKIYHKVGTPLNPVLDNADNITIKNTGALDLQHTLTSLIPGDAHYFAIRAMYGGQTQEFQTAQGEGADIIVYTPPAGMALVHPFLINTSVCEQLGSTFDPVNRFRCPFTGEGNVNSFFDFDQYLFVDRYELAKNAMAQWGSFPNRTPELFINAFLAQNECTNLNETVDGANYDKRLLARYEWLYAAEWPSSMTSNQIESAETSSCNNSLNIRSTGLISACQSRYGIFDMPGNIWEWNSDIFISSGILKNIDNSFTHKYENLATIIPFSRLEVENTDCISPTNGLPFLFDSPDNCGQYVKPSSLPIQNDFFYFHPRSGNSYSRSGGGQENNPFYQGKSGIWTFDYRVQTTNSPGTGARCGFTLPF